MGPFHTASDDEIKKGLTTDIYFKRTVEILKRKNVKKRVVAEFTVGSLPDNYPWAVFAGLEYVVRLLEGLPVNLYSIPEGTLFTPRDPEGIPVPVMFIEGEYSVFSEFETPALGFICQASGIATKSARIKKVAGDSVVLSFGVRRMHPALAPFIDRNAYIGGCDGVSSILGAEAIGKRPTGTMPHALMLVMGEEEAWKAYDEVIPQDIPRIALIDTFGDEKFAALEAASKIKDLLGVRLDTPASRRGNMERIVKEVRWELNLRGFENVRIYVSGGLDEDDIPPLKKAGAFGFGVGTSISNAPTIDFAMDIVEVEGIPLAKKGKFSGKKKVWRCNNCLTLKVTSNNVDSVKCFSCGQNMELMLVQYIENGKMVRPLPTVDEIRSYVLTQIQRVDLQI
uniref:nicotinate phosphoribosyltransferase n=1 Tax=candidate division WOR-3 bacterium TaxID=2052148 RepID=A0A7V3ZY05_UNCW3